MSRHAGCHNSIGFPSGSCRWANRPLFGREYIGFGDGQLGQDLPRQFDDNFFDRVSQVGPGAGPLAADAVDAGSISPGAHQVAVVFVTRQGYWTVPSPPVTWTSAEPAAPAAWIPTADLKPLFDFVQDCRACKVQLDAARADLKDEQSESTALSKERDAAVKAVKGGGFWTRVKRNAKWLAIGAIIGAAAAHAAP